MIPVKCRPDNTLKNFNSILIFGTSAWACLDTRAARLRLAADKPTHKLKPTD